MGPAGVCVNAVAPGLVSNAATAALDPGGAEHVTARAPQGRAIPREMEPRDLLGVVAFLSSPVSNFVTGQTIVVDGGRVMT
jgi:NAD(P)-dependent dehydrogenase (short-subunit alcohol dehydrogenase family)